MKTTIATILTALMLAACTEQLHDTGLTTRLVIKASDTYPTCSSATEKGDVCVADDIEVVDKIFTADLAVSDDLTVTDDLAVTGLVTIGETLAVTGNVSAPAVAVPRAFIRFCGNGPNGATATYMGPVLLDDTEADLAFGGAGCDALDNTTEATADAPWHAGFAFKPVAMACVAVCTGASAANDAVVFQLRDDAASVSGMTCTTAALGGDGVPGQCTVRDLTPETVAAASTVAVSITMTNDACTDAGDDFECLVEVNF